jgi:serine/threonine protein kinase
MSYCLNSNCLIVNSEDNKFCTKCGYKLLLKDRYRGIKLIGQGGFGRTFLARDEDKPSKPFCVIKQFFPMAQDRDALQKASELFAQEAVRLDDLGKHPQIPELLAYFIAEDNRQYLVQEYIEGQTLQQELDSKGVFNQEQIISLLIDILPILEFIHNQEVIHRDIKPDNIIRRNSDNKVVLVDFGVAKLVTQPLLSVTGTMIGTAGFTAPEQGNGKPIKPSDLYSLGVTCIYLLTGVNPLILFDLDEHEWTWKQHLGDNKISHNLEKIIDNLIIFGAKKRYQNASEVWAELEKFPITIISEKEQKISVNFDNISALNNLDSEYLLDELDLARVQGVASYFESRVEKILKYHQDHKASKEEAEIISHYYQQISEYAITTKNQAQLGKLIEVIKNLIIKISRYQHDDKTYRWQNSIQRNAVDRLTTIYQGHLNSLSLPENIIVKPLPRSLENLAQPQSYVLDELDQALVKSVAYYFESMIEKILQYHQDHNASKEEAIVIANYYKTIGEQAKQVTTQKDLKKLIEVIEKLIIKISRYQHGDKKYRWDSNLQNHAINRLKPILRKDLSSFSLPIKTEN